MAKFLVISADVRGVFRKAAWYSRAGRKLRDASKDEAYNAWLQVDNNKIVKTDVDDMNRLKTAMQRASAECVFQPQVRISWGIVEYDAKDAWVDAPDADAVSGTGQEWFDE